MLVRLLHTSTSLPVLSTSAGNLLVVPFQHSENCHDRDHQYLKTVKPDRLLSGMMRLKLLIKYVFTLIHASLLSPVHMIELATCVVLHQDGHELAVA